MQITEIIVDLLYTHDCVILPGMGGLLTNPKAAEVDLHNHTAKPRSRTLAFNAKLQENDGVLIHAVAKKDGSSYSEAQDRLAAFVKNIENELASTGHYSFKPLGTFYKNEGKLIFIPSLQQNFELKSYGLPVLKLKNQQASVVEKVFVPENAAAKTEVQEKALSKKESLPVLKEQRKEKKKEVAAVKKRRSYKDLNVINVLGSVFLLAMFFTLFNFEMGDGSIYQMVDNQAQILLSDSSPSDNAEQEKVQSKDLNTLLADYQNNIKTVYYEILLDGTYSKAEVENIQLEISEKYPQSKIIEVENNEYTVSVISFMNEDLAKEYRSLIQKNTSYELIIKSK